MSRKIPNSAKLTAFCPVRVPKVKDVFKRLGYRQTSQSASGQVADFSRNPLESFDGENRRMSQHYYEKYREMVECTEEVQKEVSAKEKDDDSHPLEDKKSEMEQ